MGGVWTGIERAKSSEVEGFLPAAVEGARKL
jgi:hypothetical protein